MVVGSSEQLENWFAVFSNPEGLLVGPAVLDFLNRSQRALKP